MSTVEVNWLGQTQVVQVTERPTLLSGPQVLTKAEYHNVIFDGLVKWVPGVTKTITDATWDLKPGANFGTYASLLAPSKTVPIGLPPLVVQRTKMDGHNLSAFLNGFVGTGYDLSDFEITGTVDGFHQDMDGYSKITRGYVHDGSFFRGTAAQTGHADGVTHGDSCQHLVGKLDIDDFRFGGYSNAGLMVSASIAGKKLSGTYQNIKGLDGFAQSGINLANVSGIDDLAGITIKSFSQVPTKHYTLVTFGTVKADISALIASGMLPTRK